MCRTPLLVVQDPQADALSGLAVSLREEERQRRCEEQTTFEMTRAVAALSRARHFTGGTDKEAWAAGIERLAIEAKRVRDDLSRDQGPIQYVC